MSPVLSHCVKHACAEPWNYKERELYHPCRTQATRYLLTWPQEPEPQAESSPC